MTRDQLWTALRDRALSDEPTKDVLDAVKLLDETRTSDKSGALLEHDFDASNLKLPYASTEDPSDIVWK